MDEYQIISSFLLAGKVRPYIIEGLGGLDVKLRKVCLSLGHDAARLELEAPFSLALVPMLQKGWRPIVEGYDVFDLQLHMEPNEIASATFSMAITGPMAASLRRDVLDIFFGDEDE